MRFFNILRVTAVLAVGVLAAGARADAQGFGISVTNSTGSILVSNSLTYFITVTNLIPEQAPFVVVSNVLPASVQYVQANSDLGFYTNYGNITVFYLGQFVVPTANLTLTVMPTAAGSITNTITVASTNFVTNFITTTNSVTQVTNSVLPQADLGVAMTGPLQAVIVNDWMTYRVTATNAGPAAAPNTILTNTLPPGVILKSISPANQPHTVVGSNLIFNLGTFAAGAFTNLQFTVQPTNAGVQLFSAAISASGITDPNPTNNSAGTNINVLNYQSGPLFVVTNSAQLPNQISGLTEQSMLVSNNVGTNVLAVRLVVTGLTKQLFNAVGTNNGNPFVVLNTTLAAGQSANLRLQFAPRGSFPLASSQLQAFGVPLLNLTPPAAASTSKLLNISRIIPQTNGTVLLEFPTTEGRTYTVVYYDGGISSSNAMMAPPSIVAAANRVLWLDYGPPTTTSLPASSSNRFYRVFQNP